MAFAQENLEELVVGLYDREALKFGDFTWPLKSGRQSPVYYNQRGITSINNNSELSRRQQLRIRGLAIAAYSAGIDSLDVSYNHLFGIPQSVTSLGGMVAYERGDSILWGRVGNKTHGIDVPIEGDYAGGENVINLDDVITDAKSKVDTADNLGKLGLNSVGFVVMFDREEGGRQTMEKAGYKLISVSGLGVAMNILGDAGRIGDQEFDWVAQYQEGFALTATC